MTYSDKRSPPRKDLVNERVTVPQGHRDKNQKQTAASQVARNKNVKKFIRQLNFFDEKDYSVPRK